MTKSIEYKFIGFFLIAVLVGVFIEYSFDHKNVVKKNSAEIIEEDSIEKQPVEEVSVKRETVRCIKKETQLEDILGRKMFIEKPLINKITKNNYYSLDCKMVYYTDVTIGGRVMKDSYIKISKDDEKAVLYVSGKTAKYFGADYTVLLDNSSYLIIMRMYGISGLTETVSINKNSGIGMDVKTLTFGASGQPVSDTYVLTCSQI